MQLIFGDLHGDLEHLTKLIDFVNSNPDAKNLQEMLFTGDWFGLPPHENHEGKSYRKILELREQQYQTIKKMLPTLPPKVRLFQVPGNYDREFLDIFPDKNIHHKKVEHALGLMFGHGGSYYSPTGLKRKIKDPEKYNPNDFLFQDRKQELALLIQTYPDLVLSHSPSREYINHFLTNQTPQQDSQEQQNPRKLVYFGGHIHLFQYHKIQDPRNPREVYIIRPGALGRTQHGHTKDILPSTFMMLDPTNPEYPNPCTLYTFQNSGETTKQPLKQKNITLQGYNDREENWRQNRCANKDVQIK